MKPFETLTKLGQVRRLAQLARAALPHWEIDAGRLRFMAHGVNTLFRLDTPDGPVAVRVHRPEHHTWRVRSFDWMADLARHGIEVPAPIPTRDGRIQVWAEAPGVPQPRQVALLTWAPGQPIADRLTPARLEAVGRIMARLHAHAETYAGSVEGVPVLTDEASAPGADLISSWPDGASVPWLQTALVTNDLLATVRSARERIAPKLRRLFDEGPNHLLHSDLHGWNVMMSRARVTVIDFDDLRVGHPARDIGVSGYGLQARENFEWAPFQRGYESVRPWPIPAWLTRGELMTAHALELLHEILHEDPNDPGLGPHLALFLQRLQSRITRFLER